MGVDLSTLTATWTWEITAIPVVMYIIYLIWRRWDTAPWYGIVVSIFTLGDSMWDPPEEAYRGKGIVDSGTTESSRGLCAYCHKNTTPMKDRDSDPICFDCFDDLYRSEEKESHKSRFARVILLILVFAAPIVALYIWTVMT